MCTLPSSVLKDRDGIALPPFYIHVKGKAPIGFFRPANEDEEMTWNHIRTYAQHFGIGPEAFGLTAGWLCVPTGEQWVGSDASGGEYTV